MTICSGKSGSRTWASLPSARWGGTVDQGRPQRLSLPTYVKDVVSYWQQPGQTLAHKIHPAITTTIDMLENHDFYGTKIRNEDDPIVKQALDSLKFIGKQFQPFS